MKDTYTAVVKKSDDWWIGWIEEVPGVNCQESSRDELIETLRITLKKALELTAVRQSKQQEGAMMKNRSPYEAGRFAASPKRSRLRFAA